MARYRKIPVEVDAVRWTASNMDEISRFTEGSRSVAYDPTANSLYVSTPEGQRRCAAGDWLVRDRSDVFYSIKEADFAQTYEEVHALEAA